MTLHTIYALIDPVSREVRYIGRTCKEISERVQAHLQAAKGKDTELANWLLTTLPNGGPVPVILDRVTEEEVTVEDGKSENSVSAAEIKWIKRFERRGLLTNRWIDRSCRAYKRLVNQKQREGPVNVEG